MAVGPIFEREVLTVPRRLSHYLMRSGLVAALLILFYSLRQATIGFQDVVLTGDLASFSALTLRVFVLLELTLSLFFATLFAASIVAQEKDRRTLILLLMTDLRNYELAVGKLLAGLLNVSVLVAVCIPVLCFLTLPGGVSWSQILWSQAIVVCSMFAAGSWGCLVAFWREKTFQILAISVLGVVLYVLAAEAVGVFLGPKYVFSPYSGMFAILNPLNVNRIGPAVVSAWPCLIVQLMVAVLLNALTVIRLRVWNPSKEVHSAAAALPETTTEETQVDLKPAPPRVHRAVWNQPVIWREMRTRAYGKRMAWIKLAYVALTVIIASISFANHAGGTGSLVLGMVSPPAFALLGIGILSLLLSNAQAVTSITNERDGGTLDILLVTDLRPWEFILGKIGGALWNAREMIVVPLLLVFAMAISGTVPSIGAENTVYLCVTFVVLSVFAVTLGLHAGLSYENSRQAIAHSLGTMFFLCVGIFVFMLLLVEARSSFAIQLQSFILFIGFGSLGLYSSLTFRNPSNALQLASLVLPFLTFYAITEFLLGGNLGVCFWICLAYGFTAVAMMVPAMNDFDIALGRNAHEN